MQPSPEVTLAVAPSEAETFPPPRACGSAAGDDTGASDHVTVTGGNGSEHPLVPVEFPPSPSPPCAGARGDAAGDDPSATANINAAKGYGSGRVCSSGRSPPTPVSLRWCLSSVPTLSQS